MGVNLCVAILNFCFFVLVNNNFLNCGVAPFLNWCCNDEFALHLNARKSEKTDILIAVLVTTVLGGLSNLWMLRREIPAARNPRILLVSKIILGTPQATQSSGTIPTLPNHSQFLVGWRLDLFHERRRGRDNCRDSRWSSCVWVGIMVPQWICVWKLGC